MNTIKDLKYKVIKNFLTKEEIKLLTDYCRIKHRSNINEFDFVQNKNGDTGYYGDPIMESLMINKLGIMQKETNLQLLPTYSFWRMYSINADLKKHLDRESCEISVTVMIGSDGVEWPIFIEGKKITLFPGEAVVYLGCELEHWREKFTGDWQAQTFLHYVEKDGINKEWFRDKRSLFGEKR